MKKQYTQPELYVENVVVENGIAASPTAIVFGDFGESGDGGENYVDSYGDF